MSRRKRKASSNEDNSVADILSSLQEALSKRQKELEAREEKLREDLEHFEAERSKDYGKTEPSDVLHLNIGGHKIAVLRRTLTSIPGSMLASKFSGRWDDSLEKDKDGNFFIDQDYSLFKHMIDYLRNKANKTEEYELRSPTFKGRGMDDDDKINFYRMVEYYGMTNGIYPTKLITSEPDESFEVHSDKRFNAEKWTTFILARDGHNRYIRTYEVTLGKAQRVQIGWSTKESFEEYDENKNIGTGDVEGTIALDLTRSSFIEEGSTTPIEISGQTEGTVVRSEDYGKVWYVNGNRLDHSSSGEIRDGFVEKMYGDDNFEIFPAISLKGEFKITFVKLDNGNGESIAGRKGVMHF